MDSTADADGFFLDIGAEVHFCLLRVLEAPGQAPHSRFVTLHSSLYERFKITNSHVAWVDTVKTSASNELPPQDPDWYAPLPETSTRIKSV